MNISLPLKPFSSNHDPDQGTPTTIMKLTGYKDLKTLMKYENTGDEAVIAALEELT